MDSEGPIGAEEEANSPEPADDDGGSDGTAGEFTPEGFDRWRRDSPLGSIGTGIAKGLQSVFAPPPNQPLIVASVPGDPPDPDRIQVILDPDDPSKSVALLPPAHEAGSSGSSGNSGSSGDADAPG